MKINKIVARQVLDSRGNPTVEAEIWAGKGHGRAIVPSGASTGIHEALELRDNTKAYGGKAVTKAVKHINVTIAKAFTGRMFRSQELFDQALIDLDGTVQKSRLGQNAILACSMAFCRAVADAKKIPLFEYISQIAGTTPLLPLPFANVLNGGVHAGNELEFQEFMIVPVRPSSFAQATQMVAETYHVLKGVIKKKYGANAINVGDEGGFAPPVKTAEECLNLIVVAIKKAGYEGKIKIAMDPAASEFFHKGKYLEKNFSSKQLQSYYMKLLKKYPIISLEDPFDQDDFASWEEFKPDVQVVGDDITVTNPTRVMMCVERDLCNSLLLKVNQIGTLSESITAARIAIDAGWTVMVSHRSGETEDSFIADLATGLGVGQIKLGAPCRSDRVAKYNQLLRIEDILGKNIARF